MGDGIVVTIVLRVDLCHHVFGYLEGDQGRGVKSYHVRWSLWPIASCSFCFLLISSATCWVWRKEIGCFAKSIGGHFVHIGLVDVGPRANKSRACGVEYFDQTHYLATFSFRIGSASSCGGWVTLWAWEVFHFAYSMKATNYGYHLEKERISFKGNMRDGFGNSNYRRVDKWHMWTAGHLSVLEGSVTWGRHVPHIFNLQYTLRFTATVRFCHGIKSRRASSHGGEFSILDLFFSKSSSL